MSAWIPITIAAAFVQNLRFMLQKHVRAVSLSTAGATFARFVFSFPLAIGLVAIYADVTPKAPAWVKAPSANVPGGAAPAGEAPPAMPQAPPPSPATDDGSSSSSDAPPESRG